MACRGACYLLLGGALDGSAIAWPPLQRRPAALAWLLAALAGMLTLLGPLVATQETAWPLLGSLQQRAAPWVARLGGTINPNILAGAIVCLLPLIVALALARQDDSPLQPALLLRGLLALAVLMVAIMALAASRGALLAGAAGLFIVLWLRWPRLGWLLPPLLLAIACAFYWIGPQTLLDQMGSGGAVGGLAERLEIWSRALYALQDFSFTGVGLGAFNQVIPLLYPYFLIPPSIDIPHAHNLVLPVGVDLGVPGLVTWLAILLTVFVQLGVTLRQRCGGLTTALAAGVLGGLVAMLAHGLLDAPLWGCLLYTSPSPRDRTRPRMPSSA